jgi:dTMP kinase
MNAGMSDSGQQRTTGLFISFEGGDGCGKSTQIRLFADRIRALGLPLTLTREPGSTGIGKQIRAVLLDPAHANLAPRAEALLYAADRAQHVASVVNPALTAGRIVVTDRYDDSSKVYQGHARGMGMAEIAALSTWGTSGLTPDLTIILDADPIRSLARVATTEFGTADRIEDEPLTFHEMVRDGFLSLALTDPDRYRIVDALGTPDQVAARVWAAAGPALAAAMPSLNLD